MPKRTDSHRIADAAVNRVVDIFTKIGCACETIKQDYGEDVLVHPAFGDEVQDYRIWIQVKGTKNISRIESGDGTYKWPVSADHAIRWIRSREYLLVALWNITDDVGYYSIPRHQLSDWSLRMSRGGASIVFRDTDRLTLDSARRILWDSWLSHYDALIAEAVREQEIQKNMGLKRSKEEGDKVLLRCFEVLVHLKIVDDDATFDPKFLSWIANATSHFKKDDAREKKHPKALHVTPARLATTLALASWINEKAGTGVPLDLLETTSAVAGRLIRVVRSSSKSPPPIRSTRKLKSQVKTEVSPRIRPRRT